VGITISNTVGEMGAADRSIMQVMSKRRCCRSWPV